MLEIEYLEKQQIEHTHTHNLIMFWTTKTTGVTCVPKQIIFYVHKHK